MDRPIDRLERVRQSLSARMHATLHALASGVTRKADGVYTPSGTRVDQRSVQALLRRGLVRYDFSLTPDGHALLERMTGSAPKDKQAPRR